MQARGIQRDIIVQERVHPDRVTRKPMDRQPGRQMIEKHGLHAKRSIWRPRDAARDGDERIDVRM